MSRATKDTVHLSSQDIESLKSELTFIFSRIMDRLDALEGIRGSFNTESTSVFNGKAEFKDSDGNVVHSVLG